MKKTNIPLIDLIRTGIPVKDFREILTYTSLTIEEISEILSLPKEQLAAYDDNHLLDKRTSSHLVQLAKLFDRGYKIIGKEEFKIWVRSQVAVLENNRPIEILDSSIGIKMITEILDRIEQGVSR